MPSPVTWRSGFPNSYISKKLGKRAIAFDLRGHGRSDAPADDDDYGIDAFASDLDAVVEDARLERFILVGHSTGAQVAGEYAQRHPKKVSRLVLVDPAGDNSRLPREQIDPYLETLHTDQYKEAIEKYYEEMLLPNATGEVRERVLAGLEKAPRALAVNATIATIEYNLVPAVESYLASGGHAVTVTADVNQGPFTLHALIPELPHRHISGTSHFLTMDTPDRFNQILNEVLSNVIWRQERH